MQVATYSGLASSQSLRPLCKASASLNPLLAALQVRQALSGWTLMACLAFPLIQQW